MGPHRLTSLLALGAIVAAAALAAPAAAAPRPQGVDVSRFNGPIDWAQVAASRRSFAFIAASRGSGADCLVKPKECGADPYWAPNAANARAAGLRIGAYHRAFASGATRALARADAAAEAAVFVAQVGRVPAGDLIPVLDVETPFTSLSPSRLRSWITTWMKRVRRGAGAKAMIYTNATSWGATGSSTQFVQGHPLWVAQWSVPKPTLIPAGNWGGRGWSVWQYTSSGAVPGIAGRVDLDTTRVPLRDITFG
jgi:lysozyme